MTITEFLLARITEDEAAARRRVLAECAAKRAIVEEHAPFHTRIWNDDLTEHYRGCSACCEPDDWDPDRDGDWYPCRTVRHLAVVYADHPDYRAEWRAAGWERNETGVTVHDRAAAELLGRPSRFVSGY